MERVPSPTVRGMASQSIEQSVRRLDNDVNAIYGMISDIQKAQKVHDARFDAMDARFDAQDVRFDAIEERLRAHDARFESVEGKLDRVLAILER